MTRRLSQRLAAALMVASLLTLTACDDSTGTSGNTLLGTWNVTSFSVLNMDLIQLGTTVQITLASNGTYTINIASDVVGLCDDELVVNCQLTGDYESTSTVLTLDPDDPEANATFTYTISGSTLTLNGSIDETPVVITATRVS